MIGNLSPQNQRFIDAQLARAILREFSTGCAMLSDLVVDDLNRQGWAKRDVRRAMTRLRREGRLRYDAATRFWSLNEPNPPPKIP